MLLVLTALAFEAAPLQALVRRRGLRACVRATGVGAAAAGRGAREAIAALRPRLLVGCGLCGALVAEAGTVARPAAVLAAWGGGPIATAAVGGRVSGRIVTVPAPVCLPEEKAALAARFGALWADQESYAWAEAAEAARVPLVLLRVVLDRAHEPLPVARRPNTWPAALLLPRRALQARRALVRASAELLCALN